MKKVLNQDPKKEDRIAGIEGERIKLMEISY